MLKASLEKTRNALERTLDSHEFSLKAEDVGRIISVSGPVAYASGLNGVTSEELVQAEDGTLGIVASLDPAKVGIILLSTGYSLKAGHEVKRLGRVADVMVGEEVLGRVIDATGKPLDEKGTLPHLERSPLEHPAPAIMDRLPVASPLETGIKVIDALIPIGKGQRELILGDRQTGKTSIALDAIVNQKDKDVICIYAAIGQRESAVAKVVHELEEHGALAYTVVVVSSGQDAPGLQYITPYAATSIGEYFMSKGRNVLIVYDDLTRHARSYREISLLLERSPGREAYPGDIFYIHSRLLERATHLRQDLGGGSLTALPIVETEAQNLSAYIPTNIISITDGQVYLSPDLFSKGMLPAVDVGKSVSRVGGKAQKVAYRDLVGQMRLSYAQFEELETFARFATRLDDTTKKALERGKRVREVLRQSRYSPLKDYEQVAVMLALTEGLLDAIEVKEIKAAEQKIREKIFRDLPHICQKIRQGDKLSEDEKAALLASCRQAVAPIAGTME
ncbi:MAG: F0F1 ATP synthase subunit alpha [Desulfobacterales bacterium]|nr:MAG: F0F1 ATP synthase subunit alpha [Desulfobacterales bacterium]